MDIESLHNLKLGLKTERDFNMSIQIPLPVVVPTPPQVTKKSKFNIGDIVQFNASIASFSSALDGLVVAIIDIYSNGFGFVYRFRSPLSFKTAMGAQYSQGEILDLQESYFDPYAENSQKEKKEELKAEVPQLKLIKCPHCSFEHENNYVGFQTIECLHPYCKYYTPPKDMAKSVVDEEDLNVSNVFGRVTSIGYFYYRIEKVYRNNAQIKFKMSCYSPKPEKNDPNVLNFDQEVNIDLTTDYKNDFKKFMNNCVIERLKNATIAFGLDGKYRIYK